MRVLVHLFFLLPLFFTLVAASISQFLTAAKKNFMSLFQRKMSYLFFISRSSSLSPFSG